MQRNILFFLATLLLGSLTSLPAQRPEFPRPNRADQIPFGQRQIVPGMNDARGQNLTQFLSPGKDHFKQPERSNRPPKAEAAGMSRVPTDFLTNQMMNRKPGITKAAKKSKAKGSNFQLAADINTRAESDPGNITTYLSHLDWVYPVVNNVAYFEGDDGIHGRELLRSDGTAAGTYTVKDINPGEASTLIYNMTAIGNKVYFAASTNGYGFHPWVTDGTAAGTHELITNDWVSYSPQQFIQVGDAVYMIQDGQSNRTALWQTDGTPGGTFYLLDLATDYIYEIQQATSLNGLLFFTAYSFFYGRQVWRSDGTREGTYSVKNVSVWWDNFGPMQLTAYANKLYFSADDGTGRKLWITDGTEIGTVPAEGSAGVFLGTEYLSYNITQPFPVFNDVLYLPAYSADGNGWYKYDAATGDGLVLVQDLFPPGDNGFIIPGETRLVGETLYLKVVDVDPGGGDQLWRTTGPKGHIQLVKSFAGEPGSYMICLKRGYDKLYFVKYDAVYGSELWKSDGTTAGTVIVKDVNAGPTNSQPWYMTELNGKVIYSLHGAINWAELWGTDGTVAGTTIVKDINTTASQSSFAGTFYNGIISTGKGVLFGAYTDELGGELYESNGKSNGTALLHEIYPGPDWSYPNSMVLRNGSYFFIADNPAGTAIYRTDDKKKALTKVIPGVNRDQYWIVNFDIAENGRIFYLVGNRYTGYIELWTTAATGAGTLVLSTQADYSSGMITCGNNAYFGGGDAQTGFEIWKSDGTIAGTKMLKDIWPGSGGSYPFSLVSYKGNVYFGASWDPYNPTLWKTDGTEAGTYNFANIRWPLTTKNEDLELYVAISNNILYFNGESNDDFRLSKLWKTDGTIAGTKQVTNELIGAINLTDVDGTLFFQSYVSEVGRELWKVARDATRATLVKDMTPGGDSYITYPTSAAGKLFFVLDDELWSSDGTAAGTQVIKDELLSSLSGLGNLTATKKQLFLSGYNYRYGAELFVGNTGKETFNAQPIHRSITAEPELPFKVYPNPARDEISISFTRPEDGVAVISITNLAGQVIQTKKVNTRKGANIVSISIRSLPAGSYLVKQDGGDSGTRQFVKTK